MSHYSELKINALAKNQKEFVSSLEEIFGKGHVETHPEGSALYGYCGDDRSVLNTNDPNYAPKCHIVVRRQHVGSSANDIGFHKNEDGKFVAYVSEYDSRATFPKDKQNKLAQTYAVKVAEKQLKGMGYTYKSVKQKDGTVKLTASKFK